MYLLQTVKSQQAMADAMKGVTKAMIAMNKKMDVPALQKLMQEFMKENERSELTQEMMGDAIDDAMEDEGSAEQEDSIINQVLDEIGINTNELLLQAPTNNTKTAANSNVDEKQCK